MNLIIVQEKSTSLKPVKGEDDGLLKFALTSRPLCDVVLNGLSRGLNWESNENSVLKFSDKLGSGPVVFAVPSKWTVKPGKICRRSPALQRSFSSNKSGLISYENEIELSSKLVKNAVKEPTFGLWFAITNGRFATQADSALIKRVLNNLNADVVAINVTPELLSEREKVRLTNHGMVAGLRRLYSDSAELAPLSSDWPVHLFIRTKVLEHFLDGDRLPLSFSTLLDNCRKNRLTIRSVNIGGAVLDLANEKGLFKLCQSELSEFGESDYKISNSTKIPLDARLFGEVLLGDDVILESGIVIAGPSIISDNVDIEKDAIIHSSVIGPGVRISRGKLVQNRIEKKLQDNRKTRMRDADSAQDNHPDCDFGTSRNKYGPFRTWSFFSYAGFLKRVVDFCAALFVLILFAPIIPFVALAIKLNSPGPVFFKDKRQGLHGKEFNCLKFRTMITGADKIQEKLRKISQVDGPQFKMEDDPRISSVGRFLRETYIDEIPQFFNVLLGHMSVVGPRPSPVSENTLCPFWRDARLSVRPGITGLWQVNRTREPMKDFQEWIYYDTNYVRVLSLKTDLWVCWQTTKKMFDNFISQF